MLNWVNIFEAFLIGISIGSFLNVVFYRLPNDISLISPRSFCPKCKKQISWRENIPLFSWIIQKGRCLSCKEKISIRYPFVELTSGLLFVLFREASPSIYFYLNSIPIEILFNWFFVSLLFIVSLIDIKYYWIPQIFINLGFLFAFFNLIFVQIVTNFDKLNIFINYSIASVVSYLLFESLRVVSKYYFKKDALGKGDSKLVSMMALWLGPLGTSLSLFITYVFSALCLLSLIQFKVIKRNQIIPFAPFLCFGGLIVWFFGNQPLINSYLSFLRMFP